MYTTMKYTGLRSCPSFQVSPLPCFAGVGLSNFNTHFLSLLDIEVNALRRRAILQRAADAETLSQRKTSDCGREEEIAINFCLRAVRQSISCAGQPDFTHVLVQVGTYLLM